MQICIVFCRKSFHCCLSYAGPISCFAGVKQWKNISETTKVLSQALTIKYALIPSVYQRTAQDVSSYIPLRNGFLVALSSVECLIVDVQVSNNVRIMTLRQTQVIFTGTANAPCMEILL